MRFLAGTVLGLNRRNSSYIFSLNPPDMLPLVDEKIITKERLVALAIPTPPTYGIVRTRYELKRVASLIAGRPDFVVKPSRGSGGGGIVVCQQRTPGRFTVSGGKEWDLPMLLAHIDEILSGTFALDERPDAAFFEERVICDPLLETLAGSGIPDIRFLVVRGVPLLAMLRLPTSRSGGRANLHVGGVGVGVGLTNGLTRQGIYRKFLIRRHPDTGQPLSGFQMPHWDTLLTIAARCYHAVPLGYLGVDIVLDARFGPRVLELNARPGLQIQLANGMGLRPLLEEISAQADRIPEAIADRVALGCEIYTKVRSRFFDE